MKKVFSYLLVGIGGIGVVSNLVPFLVYDGRKNAARIEVSSIRKQLTERLRVLDDEVEPNNLPVLYTYAAGEGRAKFSDEERNGLLRRIEEFRTEMLKEKENIETQLRSIPQLAQYEEYNKKMSRHGLIMVSSTVPYIIGLLSLFGMLARARADSSAH
ncbi:MAG: hypothetical protein AABY07_05550 [Nanoarchaeota archaeon]